MRAEGLTPIENTLSMHLGGHISVEKVDEKCTAASPLLVTAETVWIDLSTAVTFDVIAMLRVLSVAAMRKDSGGETRFRLPRNAAARHCLRLWRFPDAVSAVTRTPFRLLVSEEDETYFGENWPETQEPSSHGVDNLRSSVLPYLVERQNFGICPYRLDDAMSRLQFVEDETARWTGYALVQLLQRVLKGSASDVARVLVPELLNSVVAHRSARLGVAGSQMELPAPWVDDGNGILTIGVWDNDVTLIASLRERLAGGEKEFEGNSRVSAQLVVDSEGWTRSRRNYDSRWLPGPSAADSEVLLAEMVAGTPLLVPPTGYPQAGQGIYTLYRTAIDVFGGSLQIRTGGTCLTVQSAPDFDGARYQVRATQNAALPAQLGNLISVRLPVHNV
ncbi:hypothetical protein AB0D14_31905 [Streptomyces sp. NPDC048484]|uniref:hypothetical protein n=1 Tax=Streptomyces sp. NPDC048484 TaxID=3155146 RepID=UPI0034282B6C